MKTEIEKELEFLEKERLKFEKDIKKNKLKTIDELTRIKRDDILKNLTNIDKPKKTSILQKLKKILYGK